MRTRLLNRSTRNLSLTPEGERYCHRCREILELMADTEASLQGASDRPQGRLRVDMPGGIAHAVILPQLAQFQQRYPDIYLMIGVNDQRAVAGRGTGRGAGRQAACAGAGIAALPPSALSFPCDAGVHRLDGRAVRQRRVTIE
ncbi:MULTISPECIES: LysR family transcriptional regulator [unclassified Janthinobacterium]|uniref:LysR family transcriptional regulator n=1 Tax=unclassified Janthinobacterium TaxID=2610881 RepID=UPI001E365211|nr:MULTISPECIES: LysR family transcriptional regulator [unclassified Janthinobacterium]